MMRYAAQTSVPVAKSKHEIEMTVGRYGATRFASMSEDGAAAVAFECEGRRVLFKLVLPKIGAFETFAMNVGHGHTKERRRSPDDARRAWEQACRQRWRALALVVKAKLEAVASGVETFEEAFMPHIVLPNGRTVGEWMVPQIDKAYVSGKMPPLLLSAPRE